MKCTHCGREIENDSVFCEHCGTRVALSGSSNGHEWVDLGLPSGTLWATCNVGASRPEEYGNYFAWGEIKQKNIYTKENYKYIPDDTILPTSDDAATANWGNGWRMPTLAEVAELYDNCESIWTTKNGINGYMFIGHNGNSIFLPAAGGHDEDGLSQVGEYGNIWSNTLCDEQYDEPYYKDLSLIYDDPKEAAFSLDFISEYGGINARPRWISMSIRPVYAFSRN